MLTHREHEAFQDLAETGLLETLRALAKMSNRQWCIFPQRMTLHLLDEALGIFPENEPARIGCDLRLEGAVDAHLLFLFPQESALTLTKFFTSGLSIPNTAEVQAMAVTEVSNILSNAFLNVLANTLKARFLAAEISPVSGPRGELLARISGNMGKGRLLRTRLKMESEYLAMSADFCMLLDEESFSRILGLIDDCPACTVRRRRIF
ncbi:MAG: hypothetical protein WC421_04825 [Elusimicrobiales bacterium]